ncbi:MAG: R3H domain-containing nucleic acid-binding protein [bacterium]|nr:R3H domain-containing nucleic acid-binding protein [bacterium]
MTKESLDIIEHVTREFLGKLGVEGEIRVESNQEGEVSVEVTLQEPQLFIGERGQTMFEISHILKALVRRKIEEPVRLAFDINDYQKNKEQYLRELARTTADEVVLSKKDKELPAMTPGERRIVHLELAERQDVVSESVGEGPERHVVVKVKTTAISAS